MKSSTKWVLVAGVLGGGLYLLKTRAPRRGSASPSGAGTGSSGTNSGSTAIREGAPVTSKTPIRVSIFQPFGAPAPEKDLIDNPAAGLPFAPRGSEEVGIFG